VLGVSLSQNAEDGSQLIGVPHEIDDRGCRVTFLVLTGNKVHAVEQDGSLLVWSAKEILCTTIEVAANRRIDILFVVSER
jgi:hypothetical protein